MIDADGWFDWAIRDPGPIARWQTFGLARTPINAIYHHSLEGWFNPVSSPGYNVMDDPTRFPTGWHWTVTSRGVWSKPGTVYQHYPVWARLHHANGGNVIGPGGESEGLFNQPLMPEQVAAWKRIHADIAALTGKAYERLPGNGRVGLCEHREAPGAETACPSERYAPLWAALGGEWMPSQEDWDKAMFRIAQLETQVWGENPKIPRNAQNPYADTDMLRLAEHVANHGGSTTPNRFDATIIIKE